MLMADLGASIIAGIVAGILAQGAPGLPPGPRYWPDHTMPPPIPYYAPPRPPTYLIPSVPDPRYYPEAQPQLTPRPIPTEPTRIGPPPPNERRADNADRAEEAEAKRATLDFCRRHPREYFCTRLEAYLTKHPELR
jgi:hypothetical protein